MCTLCTTAGIPTLVSPNIRRSLWKSSCSLRPLAASTLTRLTPAQLLAHEPTRALYRAVMQETAAVAQAAAGVTPEIVERTMHYLDTAVIRGSPPWRWISAASGVSKSMPCTAQWSAMGNV